jgi:hypothetical protein
MNDIDTINFLFATLNITRSKGILDLMLERMEKPVNRLKFEPIDHFKLTEHPLYLPCAIEYDFERAPKTTNWAQLEMIGIEPSTSTIMEIAEGLALWCIYLTDTLHLTDDQLRGRLLTEVLTEPVSMLPPNAEATEFIQFFNTANPRRADNTEIVEGDEDWGRDPTPVSDRVLPQSPRQNKSFLGEMCSEDLAEAENN